MKTLGWAWAYLRVNWDGAGATGGFVCAVACLSTGQRLFLIPTGLLWATALCAPRGLLHGVWLSLPPVKWWLHRRWVRDVRIVAAMQRDTRHQGFCWNEALSGIEDREACLEFARDINRLYGDLARAATPDDKRKEQSSE